MPFVMSTVIITHMATYNFNVREGHLERLIFASVPATPNGGIWTVKTKASKTSGTYLHTFTDLVVLDSGLQWTVSQTDTNDVNFPAYYDLILSVGATNTTVHSGYIEFEQTPYSNNDIDGLKHSDLMALDQDDHPQYLNNARGDVRYYTKDGSDARYARTVNGQPVDVNGNVQVTINGTFNESNLVHRTGTESIAGDKSFSGIVTVSGQTVVTNTDPRLVDSRNPTAHKSSHATGGSDALAATDIGAAPVDQRWKPNTQVYVGQVLWNGNTQYQVTANHVTPSTFSTTNLQAGNTVANGSLTSAAFDAGTAAALAAFSASVQVITPTLVAGTAYQATVDVASSNSGQFKITVPDGTNVSLTIYVTNVPAVNANLSRIVNLDVIQNTTGDATVTFSGVSGNIPDFMVGSQYRNRYTIQATDGFYTAKLDEVIGSPSLDQTFQMLGATWYYDFEANASSIELDKSGNLRNATYFGTRGVDYIETQPSLTTTEPNGKAVTFAGTGGYLQYGDGLTNLDWFDPHDFWTLLFLIKTPSAYSDEAYVQTNANNKVLMSFSRLRSGASTSPYITIGTNNFAQYRSMRVFVRDDNAFTYNEVHTGLTYFDGRKIFGAVMWDPSNSGANVPSAYAAGQAFTGAMKTWIGSPSGQNVVAGTAVTTAVPAASTIVGTGVTIGAAYRAGAIVANSSLNVTVDKMLFVKGKDISGNLNNYYQAMK